jgi:hypothetical protein
MARPILAVALLCCACGGQRDLSDPIDGFPASQQETIARRTIDKDWPLTVGRGTLGCLSDAVVFRANGVNYAVNDAARAMGFASIDPIRGSRPSPPPSNPLGRIVQDERMKVFAELSACGSLTPLESQNDCTRRLGARYRLNDAELRQIAAEGTERFWPPLQRPKADLQLLTDRGAKLCKP